MNLLLRFLVVGIFSGIVIGCTVGDLSVQGKRCSSDRQCPKGYSCVQRPISTTESEALCYADQNLPTCPASIFCNLEKNWVEICGTDGSSTQIPPLGDCTKQELMCNPDIGACSKSCSEADCVESNVCDLATNLCRPESDNCLGNGSCPLCIGLACVPAPTEIITSVSFFDVSCYSQEFVEPLPTPTECDLSGRVYLFPFRSSERTVGLKVQLRRAKDPETVFKGPEEVFADNTDINCGPDGSNPVACGHYRFSLVPTNDVYQLEILAGTAASEEPVVSTVTANVHLRADDCQNGQPFSQSISALSASTYESYTTGIIEDFDKRRGLLIGRILDCNLESPQPLGNVTIGLAIAPITPGRIFYFANTEILQPDLSLQASSNKGYYAVVNLPACNNQIGFTARPSGGESILSLGTVSFTLWPNSVVIADLKRPFESLPP